MERLATSTDSTVNSNSSKQLAPRQGVSRKLSALLLGIGMVSNVVVWVGAVFLLQNLTPTYTSKGAAIIPGVGTQGSVDLPEVPQTSNNSGQTPYGYLLKVDPRNNYQYIAQTEPVIAMAAASLEISPVEFGRPSVQLDGGTTIIEFEMSGETPEEAHAKAWAFYRAWTERISFLRQEEAQRQDSNIKTQLESASSRLQNAQQDISEYRRQSPLKVASQIDQLATEVEGLQLKRADLRAELNATDARLRQLSSQLGLTPQQAGYALIILDDRVIQESLQNYSEAVSNLQTLSSTWSGSSPQVLTEEAKKEAARADALQHSRTLLGRTVDMDTLARLDVGGDGRKDFLEDLIRLQVEREDLSDRLRSIEEQIEQFELRLKVLTREEFTLSRLEQEVQIAESILTGGITRLDVDKPDYTSSYPSLQLIAEPNIPAEKGDTQLRIIVLGAIAFSILSTTGLLMLWWDRSQNKKILESVSLPGKKVS